MRERVLVIGARRKRQGIGGYVAREFAKAGADVVAVVGSTAETARGAAAGLVEHGIEARPWHDLAAALAAEDPDIVAICSPVRLHREHLELVAAARAHCLCEKPLWWGEGVEDPEQTERLVDPFADRFLGLITQWPRTLTGYHRLHPEASDRPVTSFEMALGPISTGPRSVIDCLPHVLSMLQRLVGYGVVEDVSARFEDPEQHGLVLEFAYRMASGGRVEVRSRFVTTPEPPRPASYAINGLGVTRVIDLPEYTMRLVDGERSVPLADPLEEQVAAYLKDVRDGRTTDKRMLMESVAGLVEPVRVVEGLVR